MRRANSSHRNRSAPGFVILDVITGIFLFGLMATVLAVGLTTRSRGAARLHDTRTALRAAESVLADMQSGKHSQSATGDVAIKMREEIGASAPTGQRWIRIEANCHGRTVELVGLVPAANDAGGEK